MILFIIFGIMLGAVSVIFALQNTAVITVTFLAWQVQASLAIILMIAILSGMIVCLLVSLPEIITNYLKFKRISKEKEKLQTEIASYKAMVQELGSKTSEKALDSVDVNGNKISFLS